jgi:hypothetical protein
MKAYFEDADKDDNYVFWRNFWFRNLSVSSPKIKDN